MNSPSDGFFALKSAHDLRDKLRRDLEKLHASPLDSDAAFNFFVTSEHLLDWVFPKNAGKALRTKQRNDSIYLRICSHLANGAKHFEVEDKRHDSVERTKLATGGYFGSSYFGSSYFGALSPRFLIVHLKGAAAKELGPSISVRELANRLMALWDAHEAIP